MPKTLAVLRIFPVTKVTGVTARTIVTAPNVTGKNIVTATVFDVPEGC